MLKDICISCISSSCILLLVPRKSLGVALDLLALAAFSCACFILLQLHPVKVHNPLIGKRLLFPQFQGCFSPNIFGHIVLILCNKNMILLYIAWDFDIFWTLDKRRQYGATFNITSICINIVHKMVRYVPICKTCETSADMQDMCRYTRIWTTFCRACWRTLIWKSWLKMGRNIARYAKYVTICHNMLSNGEPQSSVICSNSPVRYVATVHWYESI